MSRRSLLSSMQRAQFTDFWAHMDERELVRHYTLTEADLDIIQRRRRVQNRLGFAVMLCYLRYPGRALQPGEQVPQPIVRFIAQQINAPSESMKFYSRLREQTRREHLVELQTAYSFQPFSSRLYEELSQWLLPIAMGTDKGMVLVSMLLDEMRRHRRIIQPSFSQVEELAHDVHREAQERLFASLTDPLTDSQRKQLDTLLGLREGSRQSRLTWLRQPPGSATAGNMLELFGRIRFTREIGLLPDVGQLIPQNRLLQLAREGARFTVQHLSRFHRQRRHATFVALLLEAHATLIDDTLDMHNRIIGGLFRRSEQKQETEFISNGKVINEKLIHYAQVGQAVIAAREARRDPYEAIEALMPWERFENSVREAEALAQPEGFDFLALMKNHYPQIRRYTPALLEIFQFCAVPSSQPLLEAIAMLREMNASEKRELRPSAPIGFVKARWKPYVLKAENIDRCYYELCAMAELRNGLRSGDVWVDGARQFKKFSDYLLPEPVWQKMQQSNSLPLSIETNCEAYLAQRREALEDELAAVSHLAAQQALPEVRFQDGELVISPLEKMEPDGMEVLTDRVYSMLPRLRITDLLWEVDAWTGFSHYFTHPRSGERARDRQALLTGILADAINLGPVRMAESCRGVSLRRLMWVADWHIRDETYARALAALVNYHHRIPFASHWGQGKTSSSDGQQFRTARRGRDRGQVNARYGSEPGIMFYTHISDQYAPFYTKVINATVRDATHVLDGLLYHESDLRIEEHYTDTSGFTDHIFGLCHLLGFRFAPRIRDLADKRLYIFGKPRAYPALEPLMGERLNLRQIREHWQEVLHLGCTIRTGTATASLLLAKLAAYPRQNGMALALREIGRLERTFFTLEWLQDPKLRRRVNHGLNKGEARNSLARAVCIHRLGEIHDRTAENQHLRASGLNLVVAAIILWNTVYIAQAIELLQQQGELISEEQLAHLSPLKWVHINLTGEYDWKSEYEPKMGRLRPLRLKKPAWEDLER